MIYVTGTNYVERDIRMCVCVCVYNVKTKLQQKERTGQNISSKKILRFLTLCDDKDTYRFETIQQRSASLDES